jgi:hypothetical protein
MSWAEMVTGGGPGICQFSSFLHALYRLHIQFSSLLNTHLHIHFIGTFFLLLFVFQL